MSTIDKKEFEKNVRIFLESEVDNHLVFDFDDVVSMDFLVFVLQTIGKHSRWSMGQWDSSDLPFSSFVNYECKIWSVGAFYAGSLPEACMKAINEFVKIYNQQKQK